MLSIFRSDTQRADLLILCAVALFIAAAVLAYREGRKVTAKVAEYGALTCVLVAALFWTP